jgi:carboxyl-terminal processing protease
MSKRNLMTTLTALALALFLVVASAAVAGQAEYPSSGPVTTLAPAPKHEKLDQAIASLLNNYHYRRAHLDNSMSTEILDAYIDALDFNRSFFLAHDIARFERKYRSTLDDYLKSGNLKPAYEIFNVYQQRFAERMARIQVQLARPISFDVDEVLEIDRKDAPWARSKVDLDEIWRKRLKNELLQLVLAGKDFAGALDILRKRYEAQLRRSAQSTSDDVFQYYMNAVSKSFDPHTSYFSPRTSENFDIQMRLSLEGIGTVFELKKTR